MLRAGPGELSPHLGRSVHPVLHSGVAVKARTVCQVEAESRGHYSGSGLPGPTWLPPVGARGLVLWGWGRVLNSNSDTQALCSLVATAHPRVTSVGACGRILSVPRDVRRWNSPAGACTSLTLTKCPGRAVGGQTWFLCMCPQGGIRSFWDLKKTESKKKQSQCFPVPVR